MKNSMCTLLGTPPNLVIVYTALKPRQRRALTIVIESVGKILFWKKKNTNSYLKRHLATYTEGLYNAKNNEINKILLIFNVSIFLLSATMNINTSAKHVFNFVPKYK